MQGRRSAPERAGRPRRGAGAERGTSEVILDEALDPDGGGCVALLDASERTMIWVTLVSIWSRGEDVVSAAATAPRGSSLQAR